MQIVKHERIWVKDDSTFGELDIQDAISQDPEILGLGPVRLIDRERAQPGAGRLDILLQDDDASKRYEVEIQLGKTDESHVIRTIEYWDIERRRYPQYDHCAVIVAEAVTSRFLNVIGLFNGFIPLIALQMALIQIGEQGSLVFTRVMDEFALGRPDDGEPDELVDRAYWEQKAASHSVQLVDDLLKLVQEKDAEMGLNYAKSRISFAREGRPRSFVRMVPKKNFLRVTFRLERTPELEEQMEEAGIIPDYHAKQGRYRVNLTKADLEEKRAGIEELLGLSYEQDQA